MKIIPVKILKSIGTNVQKFNNKLDSYKLGWLLKPTIIALENFFLGPGEQVETAPYIRSKLETKRFMSLVIVAQGLAALMGILYFGWRVLLVILVSYLAGGAAEALFVTIRKEDITEGFLVTGLTFALILPPTLPLWMVALGSIFGVIIGKELFGGVGHNIFNPALVGRAFLIISFPLYMSAGAYVDADFGNLLRYTSYSVDTVSAATPLMAYKLHGASVINIWNLLFGNTGGSIGETCAFVIILGGIILLLTKISDWRTVVSILVTTTVFSFIMHHYSPKFFAPPLISLLSGGLLYGSFFMATDPVTSCKTSEGRYISGFLIGIMTVLIRGLSGYAEGITFALLISNAASPLIDELIISLKYTRNKTYFKNKSTSV